MGTIYNYIPVFPTDPDPDKVEGLGLGFKARMYPQGLTSTTKTLSPCNPSKCPSESAPKIIREETPINSLYLHEPESKPLNNGESNGKENGK